MKAASNSLLLGAAFRTMLCDCFYRMPRIVLILQHIQNKQNKMHIFPIYYGIRE